MKSLGIVDSIVIIGYLLLVTWLVKWDGRLIRPMFMPVPVVTITSMAIRSFSRGGGFRGGMDYGATDEFGNSVVENAVDIHDVHATILHQMGIDHETLTFRYGGRDHRLTDVHGRVMKDWLV